MRVAIVGLGAAGLRAGMLLRDAGVEVELFEARHRVGGRIHTAREKGAVYEAGAEWIDADHRRVLSLLKELAIEPEPASRLPGRVVYRGESLVESELWHDAAEDELRFETAASNLCRNLVDPPWANTAFADLDLRTLASFIQEHAYSERGRWWLTAKYRSDEGDEPDRIGLLGWLCGYLHYLDRGIAEMSAFRIPDAWDGLLQRISERVGIEPHLNRRLCHVRSKPSGLSLGFSSADAKNDSRSRHASPNGASPLRGDFHHAILTLPPRALERVIFDPPYSGAKSHAIRACEMSRVIKLCLEFDHAWWLDEGWSGRMICDGPLQQTWDGTRGDTPILTAYICGDATELWTTLPHRPSGRDAELALDLLCDHFPQARPHFRGCRLHDWNSDAYAQGGFSHLGPGYVHRHMEHISKPEGRIHFAGEHTAIYTGFVEGALESAERVVAEILTAV